MRTFLFASALFLNLLAHFTLAGESPDPSSVTMGGLSYFGGGCPVNSVSSLLSSDAKALTLLFDSFIAETNGVGPSGGYLSSKKTCNINLNLRIPAGWSYSLFNIDFRGHVTNDKTARVSQQTAFQFGLGAFKVLGVQKLSGTYNDDYFFRNTLTVDSLTWLPCDSVSHPLKLRTQIQAESNAPDRSLITVDSIDGDIQQKYLLKWRRCSTTVDFDPDFVPLYRTYNPKSGGHFYTSSLSERNTVVSWGFRDEGVAFLVSKRKTSSDMAPVQRLYNPNNGRHYYTANVAEKDYLVGIGWRYDRDEGFVFANPTPGTSEVFRLYNRVSGSHLFTADAAEKDYWIQKHPEAWELHSPLGYSLVEPQ